MLPGLSPDRSFATSYNAVLQLARAVIACAGYRSSGVSHHQVTLEAIELAMGASVSSLAAYFDLCRRKRNTLDYVGAGVVTDTEAKELLAKALEFDRLVSAWIKKSYPQLA